MEEKKESQDDGDHDETENIPSDFTKYFESAKAKNELCTQSDVWLKVIREFESAAPNIMKVIQFVLVIPCTTVNLERFFSSIKSIKTKTRNKLKEKRLHQILRLNCTTPNSGFGFIP